MHRPYTTGAPGSGHGATRRRSNGRSATAVLLNGLELSSTIHFTVDANEKYDVTRLARADHGVC